MKIPMKEVQDNAAVGAEMRKLRKRAGLTQKELAAVFGVSIVIVSWLERGRGQWTAERIALAELLFKQVKQINKKHHE